MYVLALYLLILSHFKKVALVKECSEVFSKALKVQGCVNNSYLLFLAKVAYLEFL